VETLYVEVVSESPHSPDPAPVRKWYFTGNTLMTLTFSGRRYHTVHVIVQVYIVNVVVIQNPCAHCGQYRTQ
jgi:hypothetical protein